MYRYVKRSSYNSHHKTEGYVFFSNFFFTDDTPKIRSTHFLQIPIFRAIFCKWWHGLQYWLFLCLKLFRKFIDVIIWRRSLQIFKRLFHHNIIFSESNCTWKYYKIPNIKPQIPLEGVVPQIFFSFFFCLSFQNF